MSMSLSPPAASVPHTSPPPPTSTTTNNAEIVASALQALKENGVPTNGPQDPHIIGALLSLFGTQSKNAQPDQGKEAAAEALSNLSQTGSNQDPNIHPQLQAQSADSSTSLAHDGPDSIIPPDSTESMESMMGTDQTDKSHTTRRRNGPPTVNGVIMGSEEWTRQRKDNHKEVERRRRSNINEGINELARIVPNGTGEKAKGAILSRSVQYIHHLKENEARNIEKWTLEKLLMDQAMGDLQTQLDDARAKLQEERVRREEAESQLVLVKKEIEQLKSGQKDESNKRSRTDA